MPTIDHSPEDNWPADMKKGIPSGIIGNGFSNAGVIGTSNSNNGVQGTSESKIASGVYGENTAGGYGVAGRSPDGVGVLGEGKLAARFVGDVEVTGDIRFVNADCAEDFDIASSG